MVKLSLFFNLFIIFSVMSCNFKRCESKKAANISGHIIGGKPTDIKSYPFQVSQRDKRSNSHFCGGSIISEKFVLTAAHCICNLGKPITNYYIWVGSTKQSGRGNKYDIESAVCNPAFTETTKVSDIGLIGVKNKFVYTDAVKPVSILLGEIPPGTALTATGWGITKYSTTEVPDTLQMINLQSISANNCKKSYSGHSNVVLTDKQICTFVQNRQVGTCKGDSGGPLSYHGNLVGLVSWGIPCAKGKPDVYTKVAAYKTWINDNINQYCRKWPCPNNVLPNYVQS